MVEPYLFFNGNCADALEFYQDALGIQIEMTMRFADSPEACPDGMLPPNWDDKIMHGSFLLGGDRVMVSDGMGAHEGFAGFAISVVRDDADAVRATFDKLSAGGEVLMPVDKTFWADAYGMLKDKFGIMWMLSTAPKETP